MITHVSRRHILKQLGLAGTAALLSPPASAIFASTSKKARILIVGGGYGGVTTARYLKRHLPDAAITIIERNPIHVACPASNLVIAGWRPYITLFSHYDNLARLGIRIIHTSITSIDAARRLVELDSGEKLPFDRLVMAPGIQLDWNAIPGTENGRHQQLAHAWIAGHQTLLMQRMITSLPAGGTLIMTIPPSPYRCPPGPYERASLIASRLRITNPRAKILLIDGKKSFSKQRGFMAAWDELYPGMIEWISLEQEGPLDHIDISTQTVHTAFGRHRADVLNVIPPQRASQLAAANGLTDASGWCPVDTADFSSTLAPDIHVIGDACQAGPMPKSAFAANTQAKVCAAAISASMHDQPLTPTPLINHCYSLVSPQQAISITGIYLHDNEQHQLKTISLTESTRSDDRTAEANQTYQWYEHFRQDCFG
ncbi:MAG: hypothetical protein RIQ52_61 [Pseudomonadota bacterium]|jgi:sulfide dehydrogenase [flavocytochrome c] flavoprotein subunit